MFKRLTLAFAVLFLSASFTIAAPVKIPSGQDGKGVLSNFYDGKLLLSAGVEYDNVFERKLESENTEIEFKTVAVELALEYDKNIKGYVTLCQAMDSRYKITTRPDSFDADLKDNFILGVGLSVKSSDYEMVDIFTDLSYRQSTGINYESGNINRTPLIKACSSRKRP